MRMRGWRISLTAIMLIVGFLVQLLGTFNPTTAQEPDVDISVAYGWWQVAPQPNIRLHISKSRLYEEWETDPGAPNMTGWHQHEGHFKKVGKNHYLFTVTQSSSRPGDERGRSPCPFLEVILYPTDLSPPPIGMRILIDYYRNYDSKKGFIDGCGGRPIYWPDTLLREKLAKPK
jgi:hypothetical protein